MLVCVFVSYLAHETAGAARTRSSLRPLISESGNFHGKPRAKHAARTRTHVSWGDALFEIRIRTSFQLTHLTHFPGPILRDAACGPLLRMRSSHVARGRTLMV